MANQIAQAGNTVVPAILALEAAGFAVAKHGDRVVAESAAGDWYTADDPVAALGLVALVSARSWDWKATDEEIEAVLHRFGEE